MSLDKRVLTLDEAVTFTGYAKSYLYKLTSGGVIPFSKPNGKTIFFDREKLESWMLSNARPGMRERQEIAATYATTSGGCERKGGTR